MKTVNIPEYIEIEDGKIHKIMTYRFVKRVSNTNFLYENVKTGCKQCFDVRDILELRKERK